MILRSIHSDNQTLKLKK